MHTYQNITSGQTIRTYYNPNPALWRQVDGQPAPTAPNNDDDASGIVSAIVETVIETAVASAFDGGSSSSDSGFSGGGGDFGGGGSSDSW